MQCKDFFNRPFEIVFYSPQSARRRLNDLTDIVPDIDRNHALGEIPFTVVHDFLLRRSPPLIFPGKGGFAKALHGVFRRIANGMGNLFPEESPVDDLDHLKRQGLVVGAGVQ